MSSGLRRAVFTGAGALTPLGHDLDSFWNGLLAGTSGVRPITQYDPAGLPCKQFATLEPAFDAKKFIPATNKDGRKSLSKMVKTVQMGLCASQLCMDNAGLKKGDITPARFGIEFGCVMIATDINDLAKAAQVSVEGDEVNLEKWGRDGLPEIIPIWMLKFLPNMPACHVSIFFDAQGPNNTITTEDAAGLLALGEAYRLLQRDSADFFLVGGCESKLNPVSFVRYNTFTPMSPVADSTAVRPFDATRDGTILGEAASTLALEELEHAKARNATILGELAGYASGFDNGLKGPILAQVIRNALKDAGITPDDVDHVNAHAGGLVNEDAFEARGIREVFGNRTPVVAYKGHLGHSGAASNTTELIASLLAFKHEILPATINSVKPDASLGISVQYQLRTVTKPYAVKIAHTDLGHCSVAVIRRY
jgi:3-oxoacyl-[acyl-carrier-protein] synthase II